MEIGFDQVSVDMEVTQSVVFNERFAFEVKSNRTTRSTVGSFRVDQVGALEPL